MSELTEADQLELFGDAADSRNAATALYRKAQLLLMPVGRLWEPGEEYDRRMEAFNRIQQKLYDLSKREFPTTENPPEPRAEPAPSAAVDDAARAPVQEISISDFYAGLVVRIEQSFVDFDGQEIRAGEVLHFLEGNYFPYDGGHTLRFSEKTIRLATIVPEHEPIIENAGNAWF